ncbi:prefoldin subunit beta [Vulcanisaeta souniana]|uniref:Prefoldin subunit beta n=1 Tax=Vulcanisaeta souniana JCM 11219 TaxID=1293586 RepID=A0A830EBP6_9CREN|nr:prefoldin subunit beta [Vulcanisaeta souniana]BDR92000.1 prefoldin subunit beta [Vulcanisaeta souniana JCM 11219]GGI68678.1 prefoldin subunit beta [Vulcanisaeta souniana JCM 11219]
MSSLPPSLQSDLEKLQALQDQLNGVRVRKQQFEGELKEIERAISEIEKVPAENKVYKIVGSFLVLVTKDQALQELKDRKELLELHIKTLSRQESMLMKQIEDLKTQINDALAKLQGGAGGVAKGGG